MAGALNKLPVAISGMIFFSAPVTFFSVTAILIGKSASRSQLMWQVSALVLFTLSPRAFNPSKRKWCYQQPISPLSVAKVTGMQRRLRSWEVEFLDVSCAWLNH
jgi:hypothetical protein